VVHKAIVARMLERIKDYCIIIECRQIYVKYVSDRGRTIVKCPSDSRHIVVK